MNCHGFRISNLGDSPVVGASFEGAIRQDDEAAVRGQSPGKFWNLGQIDRIALLKIARSASKGGIIFLTNPNRPFIPLPLS